ncbi:hypothetical protein AAFF_G00399680 [Aldrovandia affinis]|uniref:Uncharacterized protein n=1 Tax=Aldrovandia affinis TaxID=143900 RepID=A0AAD7WLB3_9TELE|nr:hypothetical protein AAFF_G00399680 [Aldrovandia affinis]
MPAVVASTRRKLAVMKAEFTTMECLGIVRRLRSPWASPLHMVPKPDGGCWPCGDYRHLNGVTTPDRYPVPHMQDFSARLAGKIIFSKVATVSDFPQPRMTKVLQEFLRMVPQ